jgi:aspartate carbamoyltransferase catalytic subunit
MRHLLDIGDLDRADLEALLDEAGGFVEVLSRPIPKVPALRGKTVTTAFFEPSTRTRLSFERAAKALSADTMSFAPGTSSLSKGESLKDTVLTLQAMGSDLLVIRHKAVGAARRVSEWLSIPVVNGGDGAHQHPTQALLDTLTVRRHFGRIEGLRVAIVGDIRHSRVARSDLLAFSTLGAEVILVAPKTLLPVTTEGWPVGVSASFDEILPQADVIYLLRVQTERGGASVFPSLPEYVGRFGMTRERRARLKPGTVVMHPGPMNRGVEIADEVADDPDSLVLEQVAMGVAVRMAVLFRLLGGESDA